MFYDKLTSEITGICIRKMKECTKILPWQSFKPFLHAAAWLSAQGCPQCIQVVEGLPWFVVIDCWDTKYQLIVI